MEPNDLKNLLGVFRNLDLPCYVYDTEIIKEKYLSLCNNLPRNFKILYALKANPHLELVRFIKNLGTGADISSAGELNVALEAGYNDQEISFAGPGKTEEELSLAIDKEIIINVESMGELVLIDRLARTLNKIANIAFRINPENVLRLSGMRMGGGSKQFGIDEEQLPSFFERLPELRNVRFRGIHIFAGSQILDHEVLSQSFENILKIAIALRQKYSVDFNVINLGGGFGIPYFKGEQDLDLVRFGLNLKEMLAKYEIDKLFPNTRFLVESGRYIVGQGGFYLTKVLYKKVSRDKTYLITNGGMNHHLAASGNLGSVLRKNYNIQILNKLDREPDELVNIAGPLCTPLDILATDILLPKAEPGDIICILNSGAYGRTSSPLGFLSHSEPKETIL